MCRIKLRPASCDDLELLRFWDEQPHVIASDPSGDWNWEEELQLNYPWREQLIAELDGSPIGFIQILDPANEIFNYWKIDEKNLRAIDIWIGEAKNLNQGYGSEMMRQGLARCFAPPRVKAVIIDPLVSNTSAIRFYKRHGFREIERRILGDEKDECLVMRIDRTSYESV